MREEDYGKLTDEELHKEASQTGRGGYEMIRRGRWHATYNAALTAVSSWHENGTALLTAEQCHYCALSSANLAHGPLVKP
jgi:hypothetical protein